MKYLSKKKILLIIAIVFILGVVTAVFFNVFSPKENTLNLTSDKTATSKSSISTPNSSSKSFSKDTTERAKETLESSNSSVSDGEKTTVKQAVIDAVNAISKTDDLNPTGSYGITTSNMVQVVKQTLSAGFELQQDSVQVYESNNKNVLQFIVDMKRGDNKVTLTGNYVIGTGQVQFATRQGDLAIQSQ